jgi:hypothetical protein
MLHHQEFLVGRENKDGDDDNSENLEADDHEEVGGRDLRTCLMMIKVAQRMMAMRELNDKIYRIYLIMIKVVKQLTQL